MKVVERGQLEIPETVWGGEEEKGVQVVENFRTASEKAEISGWGDAVNVVLLRIHAKREEAWYGCCVGHLPQDPSEKPQKKETKRSTQL